MAGEFDALLAQRREAQRLMRMNAALRIASATQPADDPTPRSLDEALGGGTFMSTSQQIAAARPVVEAAAQNEQFYFGQAVNMRIQQMEETQANYRAMIDAQIAARSQDATSSDRRAERQLTQALEDRKRIWKDMLENNSLSTTAQSEMAATEEALKARTEAVRAAALAQANTVATDVWAVAKHMRDTGGEPPDGVPDDVVNAAYDVYTTMVLYGEGTAKEQMEIRARELADSAVEQGKAEMAAGFLPTILDPERAVSDQVAMVAELAQATGVPVETLLTSVAPEQQAHIQQQWLEASARHQQINEELDQEEMLNLEIQRRAARSGGAADVGTYLDDAGVPVGAAPLAKQDLDRVRAPSAPAAPGAPALGTGAPVQGQATRPPAQTEPGAMGSTSGAMGSTGGAMGSTGGLMLQMGAEEYPAFRGTIPGRASEQFVWLLDEIEAMPDKPPAAFARQQILDSAEFKEYMQARGYTDPNFAYRELGREARNKAKTDADKDRRMRQLNIDAGISPASPLLKPTKPKAPPPTLGGPLSMGGTLPDVTPPTAPKPRKVDLGRLLG